MTSRRYTTAIRTALCMFLVLLFVLPEPLEAGLFGRCRKRTPFFQRCRPCLLMREARGKPQPPPTYGKCDGKVCFMEEVVQYFENGNCRYSTYTAIDCSLMTYIYVDYDCHHPLDNCWNCQHCINGNNFGGTPTLGISEQSQASTHGRRYGKEQADRGTSDNVNITLKSTNYRVRRVGVFAIPTESGNKNIELYWVHLRSNESQGFGVGFEFDRGTPIDTLQAQPIGQNAAAVKHGSRVYNVYLKKAAKE